MLKSFANVTEGADSLILIVAISVDRCAKIRKCPCNDVTHYVTMCNVTNALLLFLMVFMCRRIGEYISLELFSYGRVWRKGVVKRGLGCAFVRAVNSHYVLLQLTTESYSHLRRLLPVTFDVWRANAIVL